MAPLVLITRPAGQHEAFASRCKTLGFAVDLLPCLQIEPSNVSQNHLTSQLNASQTVLFTSANAVRMAHQLRALPWPEHEVHAIGAATARSLALVQQPVSLTPKPPYNSEAYLEQLAGHTPGSLLIIKGRGGRGLIQPQLEKCGWRINHLDVYERIKPVVSIDVIDQLFRERQPDIISVTSDEILNNLWLLCNAYSHKLKHIPLVVNSERCADHARKLGFDKSVLIAEPPGDVGQIDCLVHWKNTVYLNGD